MSQSPKATPNLTDYTWFAIKCQPRKDWIVLDYLHQHSTMVPEAKIIVDHSQAPKKSGQLTNLSPGVIFVKLPVIGNEIVHAVRAWLVNIPHFKGFKNYLKRSLNQPMAFSPKMIAKLLNTHQPSPVKREKFTKAEIGFKIGDYLSVLRGPFFKHEGELVKIDYKTGILTIKTVFFGRLTQTEVNYTDCKKIAD